MTTDKFLSMAGAACYFQHFHYFLLDWGTCFFSNGSDFRDLQRTVQFYPSLWLKLVAGVLGAGGYRYLLFGIYIFCIFFQYLSDVSRVTWLRAVVHESVDHVRLLSFIILLNIFYLKVPILPS